MGFDELNFKNSSDEVIFCLMEGCGRDLRAFLRTDQFGTVMVVMVDQTKAQRRPIW